MSGPPVLPAFRSSSLRSMRNRKGLSASTAIFSLLRRPPSTPDPASVRPGAGGRTGRSGLRRPHRPVPGVAHPGFRGGAWSADRCFARLALRTAAGRPRCVDADCRGAGVATVGRGCGGLRLRRLRERRAKLTLAFFTCRDGEAAKRRLPVISITTPLIAPGNIMIRVHLRGWRGPSVRWIDPLGPH